MICGLCEREVEYADTITVMVSGLSMDVASVMICPGCTGRPLSDVIGAAQRGKQARKFEAEAEREVIDMTRDPGKCKEWIRDKSRWDDDLHNYVTIPGHYCPRNAVAWDYCRQHLWTHGIDINTGKKKPPGYPTTALKPPHDLR